MAWCSYRLRYNQTIIFSKIDFIFYPIVSVDSKKSQSEKMWSDDTARNVLKSREICDCFYWSVRLLVYLLIIKKTVDIANNRDVVALSSSSQRFNNKTLEITFEFNIVTILISLYSLQNFFQQFSKYNCLANECYYHFRFECWSNAWENGVSEQREEKPFFYYSLFSVFGRFPTSPRFIYLNVYVSWL